MHNESKVKLNSNSSKSDWEWELFPQGKCALLFELLILNIWDITQNDLSNYCPQISDYVLNTNTL